MIIIFPQISFFQFFGVFDHTIQFWEWFKNSSTINEKVFFGGLKIIKPFFKVLLSFLACFHWYSGKYLFSRLKGLFAITLIFNFLHRFSINFKSGLWLEHQIACSICIQKKHVGKNKTLDHCKPKSTRAQGKSWVSIQFFCFQFSTVRINYHVPIQSVPIRYWQYW